MGDVLPIKVMFLHIKIRQWPLRHNRLVKLKKAGLTYPFSITMFYYKALKVWNDFLK